MKHEINIPSELNEITVEQYQALMRVIDETDNETFIAQKMVAIFCKIRLSDVLRIRATDVSEIAESLSELLKQKPKHELKFTLGGTEFGFIPDLENMSFGEFVDLDTNISDWENFHKALAVLYRPITERKGDKYSIEPYEGTANYSEVMKYAPLSIALGALLFFWTLNNELLKATLDYLEGEVETLTGQTLSLTQSGGGITPAMHLQKEMSDLLTKLLPTHYFNA
jgi:hypothetical protein